MIRTVEIDNLIKQAFPEEANDELPGFILDASFVPDAFTINQTDMEAMQPIACFSETVEFLVCFNIEKYNAAVKQCLSLLRPNSP